MLTRGNPIGRKLGPKLIAEADPLIRTKSKELAEAGVERVPRVTRVENGRPVLEDGRVLDVANVIWCTGFRTDFGWIDLPVFDEAGQPEHARGVVESEPGCTSSGWSSSTRSRPTSCPAVAGTPTTSPSTLQTSAGRAAKAPSRALATA